jgi:Flp pilus assembly protein TadD
MVRRRGLVLAGAISALGLGAVSVGLPSHRRAEDALAAVVKTGGNVAPIRERALSLIDRHPSDWVLYALIANHLAAERTPRDALAWVNRVLFLRPRDARAHVVAARALLVLGQPSQALLEFKTAWVIGDESTLDEGLALAAKLGSWDRLLVDTPGLLTRLWERTRKLNRPDDGRALLDAAQLLPLSPAVLLEAQVLEVWQSNVRGELATVLSRLDALPLESTAQPELVILRARTLTAVGRGAEAITQLDALARKSPQDVDLAMTLADLLAKEGRPAAARAVLDRVRPFVIGPRARSALFQTEATLWMQEERWGRALDSLQTAARIEPGVPHLHYRLAECLERMGSLHSALDEVRKGRVLDSPAGAKAQDAWVDRLEAAMTQAIVPIDGP